MPYSITFGPWHLRWTKGGSRLWSQLVQSLGSDATVQRFTWSGKRTHSARVQAGIALARHLGASDEFPHLVHDAIYNGRLRRAGLTHLHARRLKSRECRARDELVGSRGRMDIIPKKVGIGVAAHGSPHQARVGDVGEAERRRHRHRALREGEEIDPDDLHVQPRRGIIENDIDGSVEGHGQLLLLGGGASRTRARGQTLVRDIRYQEDRRSMRRQCLHDIAYLHRRGSDKAYCLAGL